MKHPNVQTHGRVKV